MTGTRIRAALGAAFLGIVLTAGTAAALEGQSISGGVGPNNEEQVPTTLPNEGETEGEVIHNTPNQPSATLTPSAPSGGTLPFTGTDVLQLSVLGLGAIGVGTVMARRSRANRVTA